MHIFITHCKLICEVHITSPSLQYLHYVFARVYACSWQPRWGLCWCQAQFPTKLVCKRDTSTSCMGRLGRQWQWNTWMQQRHAGCSCTSFLGMINQLRHATGCRIHAAFAASKIPSSNDMELVLLICVSTVTQIVRLNLIGHNRHNTI